MFELALTIASRSKAVSRLIALLERHNDQRADLLRVLTYHRVNEPDAAPELDPALLSATPQGFDEQMNYLAAHYRVISMAELLEARRCGATLPPRSVMVTVDDAYCDFELYTWPILKRHRIPVTLFVPTSYPDQPERAFWWDRLHQAMRARERATAHRVTRARIGAPDSAERRRGFGRLKNWIKSLPHHEAMACVDRICGANGNGSAKNHVLGWQALRRLAAEGVTLAAHSQSHPLMNRLPCEEARQEAVGSLRDLEREIGSALPVFAYPSGGVSDSLVQVLKDEEFALAFTTARGINDLQHADLLRLRRINVGARTNPPIFHAQLLPWLVHLNRWA